MYPTLCICFVTWFYLFYLSRFSFFGIILYSNSFYLSLGFFPVFYIFHLPFFCHSFLLHCNSDKFITSFLDCIFYPSCFAVTCCHDNLVFYLMHKTFVHARRVLSKRVNIALQKSKVNIKQLRKSSIFLEVLNWSAGVLFEGAFALRVSLTKLQSRKNVGRIGSAIYLIC